MRFSNKGVSLLQQFEGFRAYPYLDSNGICTIGFGCTYYLNGKHVKLTDKPLTKDQASKLQSDILNRDFVPQVAKLLQPQINNGFVNQNMFDACVILAYNIGIGLPDKTHPNGSRFYASAVLQNIKLKRKQAAADAFLLWNTSGGVVVQGLVNRRKAERKLFLS